MSLYVKVYRIEDVSASDEDAIPRILSMDHVLYVDPIYLDGRELAEVYLTTGASFLITDTLGEFMDEIAQALRIQDGDPNSEDETETLQ